MSACPCRRGPTLFRDWLALVIGQLIGVERERAKGAGPDRGAAGVRTFMLRGLAGALAHLIGAVGIVVAGFFVTLAMLASTGKSKAANSTPPP